ncbi:MAG: DUF1631 family protein [Pseudomonadota bacterium]
MVKIVIKHAGEQLLGVGTRLLGALLDPTDMTKIEARIVYTRVKAGKLLKDNNYAFFHLQSTVLERVLRKELKELAPLARQLNVTGGALELVPFEEMDNKVAFDALSRPFEMRYADQIATLNLRLASLLGREALRNNQNPFRPDLFLSAVHQAWCEFDPDPESHALIPTMLSPEVLFDFTPMYEELNNALKRKGVLPGALDALNIKKTEGKAAAKAARAKEKAALSKQLRQFLAGEGDDEKDDGFDLSVPLIPDLPSMPQGNGGWRPSGADSSMQAIAPLAAPARHDGAAQMHNALPAQGRYDGGAHQQNGVPGQGRHDGGAHLQNGVPGQNRHDGGVQLQNGVPGQGRHDGGAQLQNGVPGQGRHDGGAHLQNALPAQGRYDGGAHVQHGSPAPGRNDGSAPMFNGLAGHGQHAGAMHNGQSGAGHYDGGHGLPMVPLLSMLGDIQQRSVMPAAPGQGGAAAHGQAFPTSLRQRIPQGSVSRGEEGTIDLLSKIFDTVYQDPSIPREIRDLIQYLQIPVLKAALVDKDFFFEEAHPARRMIDLLSRMGMEQRKGADDPLLHAMRRSVDKVGRDFDSSPGVFADAVAELEISIKHEETAAQDAIAQPIAAALKQERVVAATRSARSAVAVRVSSGEVVTVLETFLENKWTSVLTVAYSVEESKPGAVSNATKTMDELIWSVKPKLTHATRNELIKKLPGLLSSLNKWLDVIQWQDAERLQFFAELAECHASIVRAPVDLSPERQLEIAVEVAQQDALRRIEKENLVEQEPEPVVDDAVLEVDAFERNMLVDFVQADASVRRVKLAWISPLRTLFIFSTMEKQEAFSISVEKLLAACRAKRVSVVGTDGVVTRALAQAMDSANDDEGGQRLRA